MSKPIRNCFRAGSCAVFAATLTVAAHAQDLVEIDFMMNSPAAGYNSGFELALVNGYYKDAGLDVTIQPGNGSGTTAQLVAAGKYNIAFADAAAVMKFIQDGADIVIVSTILQGSPNQVTALKSSGIEKIEDIKGKRVAIPNGYSQAAMFPLVLEHIGLTMDDISPVNMPAESMVASLLQNQVDVILGSIDNFTVLLDQQGAETTSFLFTDYGAATVAQSIIAAGDYAKENPEVVEAFISASLRGWSEAIDDNAAALDAMVEVFPDAKMDLGQGQLDATEVLMCSNGAEFIGKALPAQWEASVKTLSTIGILNADKPAEDYYTYDYLPAEADLRSCPIS